MSKDSVSAPKLSVLIQTYNEAINIKPCIKSCQSIADEIIVLDMNSQDETAFIAKQLGARVVKTKSHGFVEATRQQGIDLAKNEWVLLLDADEKINSHLRRLIPRLITDMKVAAYRLPRKNIFLGQWMRHGMQWPDYQVRLFRKHLIHWPPIIHTQPIAKGRVVDLPVIIENALVHTYRTSLKQAVDKVINQSSHEQYYESATPTEKQVIKRITNDFTWRYFENEGYKDGVRGFILAKLWEFYRFMEFAHYVESHNFPEIISNKDNVKNKQIQLKIIGLEKELAQIKDSKIFTLYRLYEKTKRLFLNKK